MTTVPAMPEDFMNETPSNGSGALPKSVLLQTLMLGLCSLGFAFDVVELWLSNALATVFSAPPHSLPTGYISLLLSSVYIGAVAGAPLFGILADRRGRRLSLCVSLVLVAVASALGAASPSFGFLVAARIVSGLALGGFPPVMIAYLTDILPAARRGMLTLVVFTMSLFGAPAASFLMIHLRATMPFGIEAWRSALLIGACGAGICAAMFLLLPESAAWKKARSEAERASAVNAATTTPAPTELTKGIRSRLLWLFFLSPWATVAFPQMTGAIYVEKGFRVSESLMLVGLSTFAPMVMALGAAFGIDRVQRRTVLFLCGGVMALSILAFCLSNTAVGLTVFAAIFTSAVVVYLPAMNTYCAEIVATPGRGAILSIAWACNRAGAVIAPLILLPLSHSAGVGAMGAVIAATLIASFVLTATLPQGEAGRPLA